MLENKNVVQQHKEDSLVQKEDKSKPHEAIKDELNKIAITGNIDFLKKWFNTINLAEAKGRFTPEESGKIRDALKDQLTLTYSRGILSAPNKFQLDNWIETIDFSKKNEFLKKDQLTRIQKDIEDKLESIQDLNAEQYLLDIANTNGVDNLETLLSTIIKAEKEKELDSKKNKNIRDTAEAKLVKTYLVGIDSAPNIETVHDFDSKAGAENNPIRQDKQREIQKVIKTKRQSFS